jgi:hypothetical protein
MTVSESLMAKESSSERIQRHIESFEEMVKILKYKEEIKYLKDQLRKMDEEDG